MRVSEEPGEGINHCQHGIPSGKLTYLWKITIFNEEINLLWPFSIAALVYQRVNQENNHGTGRGN